MGRRGRPWRNGGCSNVARSSHGGGLPYRQKAPAKSEREPRTDLAPSGEATLPWAEPGTTTNASAGARFRGLPSHLPSARYPDRGGSAADDRWSAEKGENRLRRAEAEHPPDRLGHDEQADPRGR